MNDKHTPGPWTVQINGRRGAFTVFVPEHIPHEAAAADVDGIDGATVSHANRALIAASPDMLAALRDAEAGLEFAGADKLEEVGGFVPTPLLALRNVRAAIDKATRTRL